MLSKNFAVSCFNTCLKERFMVLLYISIYQIEKTKIKLSSSS
uniref:Uncharacterized protein n=1 Tax=Rhizophora mucronata TaxID=61149 RepID=A0A2P2NQX0_RHIMU